MPRVRAARSEPERGPYSPQPDLRRITYGETPSPEGAPPPRVSCQCHIVACLGSFGFGCVACAVACVGSCAGARLFEEIDVPIKILLKTSTMC